MKTISKLITGTIALLGFTTGSFAQVSATATATATIVAPIAITKTVDMNFGNVAASTLAGDVILLPDNSRTFTGGVRLPVVQGTITAASFTVSGEGTNTFAITLPTTDLVLSSGVSNTLIVNTFTSTPSLTGTLAAGTQTVTVGATLHVGASQAPGVYTSGNFTVTVNYN